MKDYCVDVLPLAQSDIDGALKYIAVELVNPKAALDLLDGFRQCFQNLKKFPFSGSELKANGSLKYAYRWILVDSYLVFYTVNEPDERVIVMRVLYASFDYLTVLKNDERTAE